MEKLIIEGGVTDQLAETHNKLYTKVRQIEFEIMRRIYERIKEIDSPLSNSFAVNTEANRFWVEVIKEYFSI